MKKNLHRALSVLLVGVLACSMLMFSACGGEKNTDVTGTTWALSGGSQGDLKITKEQIETVMGGEITYSFEADGKLVMEVPALGVSAEGTWKQDGNTVTVEVEGQSADMTLDGDTLSITQGDVVATFSKK